MYHYYLLRPITFFSVPLRTIKTHKHEVWIVEKKNPQKVLSFAFTLIYYFYYFLSSYIFVCMKTNTGRKEDSSFLPMEQKIIYDLHFLAFLLLFHIIYILHFSLFIIIIHYYFTHDNDFWFILALVFHLCTLELFLAIINTLNYYFLLSFLFECKLFSLFSFTLVCVCVFCL